MNIASTLDQPYQFAAVIYLGMLNGLIYTLSRCVRSLLKRTPAKVACDVLFALICFAFDIAGLYAATSLRLRLYHFIGLAAGFAAFTMCVIPLLKYIKSKLSSLRLELCKKRKYNKSK